MAKFKPRRARLSALEAAFAPRIRTALLRDAEAAVSAAALGASPAVAAALVRPRFLIAVLEELYVRAGIAEAQAEYKRLTATYPQKRLAPTALVADWRARLRRFITTEGATSLRAITDATRALVRRVLTQAVTEGLGSAEAARRLRSEVATLSVQRSIGIARTELVSAGNFGSLLGAQSTGLRLLKVWLATTPSARTRPSHVAANGQAVALDGAFAVGGFAARYPGDPLLPAAERVRCRCAITYRPAS